MKAKQDRPIPLQKRSALWLLLMLLIVTLVTHAVAANPGSSGQAPNQSKASAQVSSEELARYEKQGHTPSDVYTALGLLEQTGIPIVKWLAARKAGKTWSEAIEQLAKGVKLERQPLDPEKSRTLTPQEILQLMREGYAGEDIREASSILFNYGGDVRHLLQLKRSGRAWDDIRRDHATAWQEKMSGSNDPYGFGFGQDGKATHTRTGLSKQEVAEIVKLGYKLEEILKADALAAALGLELKPLVKAGEPLTDTVLRIYASLTPSQREQAKSKVKPLSESDLKEIAAQTGRSLADIKASQNRVVAVRFGDRETTPSGLTPAEVVALVASGIDLKELILADTYANARGLNFRAILTARKSGISLMELVKETDRNTPAAARKVTTPVKQPTEEELVEIYAARTGKPRVEVAALRSLGKTWREIAGVPEAELTQALEVAASWGLNDRELVTQALLQGLWVNDAYQAALLAPATKLTASEVLALKTKDNTWSNVLEQLFPGKRIPKIPSTPPPSNPRPPVKLPAGNGK
ncbi:MAG: hypothetical protein KGZ50_00205 [Peptococcaceae bacterium]|nr:hypothetical protein [Peptococcaceae bacterium]